MGWESNEEGRVFFLLIWLNSNFALNATYSRKTICTVFMITISANITTAVLIQVHWTILCKLTDLFLNKSADMCTCITVVLSFQMLYFTNVIFFRITTHTNVQPKLVATLWSLVTFRVKKNMSDLVVEVLKKTHKWPSIMMIVTNVWPMLKRPPMSLHHVISSLP